MSRKRQRRSADFNFRFAFAAIKEQQTLSHLASACEVHPARIAQWKTRALPGIVYQSIRVAIVMSSLK